MTILSEEKLFCPYCKEKLVISEWRVHIMNNVCGKVPAK